MKLIFIYGPPATGKLTIAKKLEKKTGYRIFHNHAVIDLCFATLNPKSKRFWPFARKLRLDIIKEVIKEDIPGMIMTMAYTGESDFIQQVINTVKKEKGKVYLIKVNCDIETLKKRVANKSREKFGKVTSKKGLEKWFEKYDGDLIFSGNENFILDTSKLSANQCADKILRYIKFKK